jgi:hypothetical protein
VTDLAKGARGATHGASSHLSVGAGLQVSTPWERCHEQQPLARKPAQVRSELTNISSARAWAQSQSRVL